MELIFISLRSDFAKHVTGNEAVAPSNEIESETSVISFGKRSKLCSEQINIAD